MWISHGDPQQFLIMISTRREYDAPSNLIVSQDVCQSCEENPCWITISNRFAGERSQLQIKLKPVAKRHHMVSGTLAPLYTVFGLKLGCSGAAAPIGDEVL